MMSDIINQFEVKKGAKIRNRSNQVPHLNLSHAIMVALICCLSYLYLTGFKGKNLCTPSLIIFEIFLRISDRVFISGHGSM